MVGSLRIDFHDVGHTSEGRPWVRVVIRNAKRFRKGSLTAEATRADDGAWMCRARTLLTAAESAQLDQRCSEAFENRDRTAMEVRNPWL